MTQRYILCDGIPTPEPDLMKWATWLQYANDQRRVARTEREGVEISTVFLGLDHRFGSGPPLLYETMVFGGEHNGKMDRYATKEEALTGHERMVAICFPDPPARP